jgi:hypothetical protein
LATPYHRVGLGDGAVTHEHEQWHGGVVPQKEPYFLPPVQRIRHGEVEVGIDFVPEHDIDIHSTQNRRFHVHVLRELDAKEVVTQIKVGVNPHVGLA